MQTEYITLTKIVAGEGMVLTNGEVYGKEIYLSNTDSSYNYCEIPESEYQRILEEQERANQPI